MDLMQQRGYCQRQVSSLSNLPASALAQAGTQRGVCPRPNQNGIKTPRVEINRVAAITAVPNRLAVSKSICFSSSAAGSHRRPTAFFEVSNKISG